MPAFHFWFSGPALFSIGSFALFAILGFGGIASMTRTYRNLMLVGYGFACILFFLGWWQSAKQEESSSHRDTDFSQVQTAINKIAGSANVSLNQSATEIASAVISKLEPLQKQVERLSRRADDALYQDGIQVGRVGGISLDESKTVASLGLVTADRDLDFNKDFELQNARMRCDPAQSSSSMSLVPSRSW